jgi:hypothetical protein
LASDAARLAEPWQAGVATDVTNEAETVHPLDRAVYQSRSPRVAVQGTRYGHGACTVLWIKASDNGWVLLPHGMPTLAVHLSANEFATMLNRLGGKL